MCKISPDHGAPVDAPRTAEPTASARGTAPHPPFVPVVDVRARGTPLGRRRGTDKLRDTHAYHGAGRRDASMSTSSIVGAGLSGIGAACHLQRDCPERSYVILEARERIGGTWDLFRYPGVRSDSDMHTLGYSFSPWEDARRSPTAPRSCSYVTRDSGAPRRHGQDPHRPRGAARRVLQRRLALDRPRAASATAARRRPSPAPSCSAAAATTATTRGTRRTSRALERFPGPVVHPQHWPEDLDYAGQRVRGHRQRRHRRDAGAGARRDRRPRDHAPALAHLHRVAALPRRVAEWLRRRLAHDGRLPPRPRQERGADDALLPAQPPPPQPDEVAHPPGRPAPIARRL